MASLVRTRWAAALAGFVTAIPLFLGTPAAGYAQETTEPTPVVEVSSTPSTEEPADEPSVTSTPAVPASTATTIEPALDDTVNTRQAPVTSTPASTRAVPEDNPVRAELRCSTLCPEDELRGLIATAGTTPTRIVLGVTDTHLTQTLTFPSQSNIELINPPDARWGKNVSSLTRENGFADTLIVVEEGATLTLSSQESGLIEVRARGEYAPSSKPTVHVKGTMVVHDGMIHGARNNHGHNTGAVTVEGSKALLIMNGGEITDNTRKDDPGGNQFGAANVAVADGALFVLNGGIISRGRTSPINWAFAEVGGVGIYNGASFEMNGGQITDNEGYNGGVGVWQWIVNDVTKSDYVAPEPSQFIMNGGSIDSNHSSYHGGGVFVIGNAEMIMNGGTISNNRAQNGGGVSAFDDWAGAEAVRRRAIPSTGMRSGLSHEEWTQYSPGRFIMNGGRIADNRASLTGGGVNVASNAVELYGGVIENNHASDQGGGVYVAADPWTVHLENVVVTENESSYIGGGVWLCPTGRITINVTNGAAIFGNTAATYGDDFAHDNYGSVGVYESYLAQRMLGGGDVAYYNDGGAFDRPRFDPANPGPEQVYQPVSASEQDPTKEYHTMLDQRGLRAVSSDTAQEVARNWSTLLITGNTSPRGAGIGSNGGIQIGSDDTELVATKTWRDADGSPRSTALPESITLQLMATTEDVNGVQGTSHMGAPVIVSPDADGNWSHTFRDLPRTLGGNPVQYRVEEATIHGYTSEVTMGADSDRWTANLVNTREQDEPGKPEDPPTPDPKPKPRNLPRTGASS